MRNEWRVGETGYIDGRHIRAVKGILYEARILEVGTMTDGTSPSADYRHEPSVRLEITGAASGLGNSLVARWTYGKPVPARLLRRTPYDREKRGGKRAGEAFFMQSRDDTSKTAGMLYTSTEGSR